MNLFHQTPLHLAVANCWRPRNVEVLLNYGADPKKKNVKSTLFIFLKRKQKTSNEDGEDSSYEK